MTDEVPLQAKAAPGRTRQRRHAQRLPTQAAEFPVVAIGASAGGLDACQKLLDVLPSDSGMAFILVQHLDPTHASMLVELLGRHTKMVVVQAADGMPILCNQLHIIPPGSYLSVAGGFLHLSEPLARHGTRLPFDFLLQSIAGEYREKAIAIVLSGTGADGSVGVKAVKSHGGRVIVQDPEEADFDGMPRSAVLTGVADLVVPVTGIPDALAGFARSIPTQPASAAPERSGPRDWLPDVIELLRAKTAHDFTFYKPGTLRRRIERRMAIAISGGNDIEKYIARLQSDATELNLLAMDLLINVTAFFRDPQVFALLEEKIIPDLVRNHEADQPIRVWVAGCSTGEETYSIAILFREAIAATGRDIKLQVFASDVDTDAVAFAREGVYPEAIEAAVSPARIAAFFGREGHNLRIRPELRAVVVFTVQDLLADPPFSRIDFVSCRNLLIYLQPEAQAKVVALFHFALRPAGILLLGTSETIGEGHEGFEVISKPERLYRHIGHSRAGDISFVSGGAELSRIPRRPGGALAPSRQAILAELCRRLVMEAYAPAAVLINRNHECVYSLGPTDRYLRVVSGHPTHDLLAMARPGMRTKLRAAIQRATDGKTRVVIAGGRSSHEAEAGAFNIVVQPLRHDGDDLFLVCFVDDPRPVQIRRLAGQPHDASRVHELEQELEATRSELQGAVHNLEASAEEQKAINEEALSIQEEFQSTNEELLTSKEELQSLNEELTALNTQLQETLDRQRTMSNDLQNVLYSTDVATLFLDRELRIRLFTPATKALFNIIPGDIGRPLSDLRSLVITDSNLTADARRVLLDREPLDREIETENGAYYTRRVMPYVTQDHGVEGVVITFSDMTERHRVAGELGVEKRHAEMANAAKSRFLAAASHDLRQPLQTLKLVQGLLLKHVTSDKGKVLVGRLGETLGAMTGMLNALLDINQIETGMVHAEPIAFPVDSLLVQLRDEFTYFARAKGLVLDVVPCSLMINSDPRLLEQIIRNLVANAMKYTHHGKVLLGCRRHGNRLGIEIWDTGIGIAPEELKAIFEEYHQIDNPARERARGLGLGLSIVHRLGGLLGHEVTVRSQPGKGSVFSVMVGIVGDAPAKGAAPQSLSPLAKGEGVNSVHGNVLVIEDDPDVRELLEMAMRDDGYDVTCAPDGVAALDMVRQHALAPDIILADYNLPRGMNGVETVVGIRAHLHRAVPAIILTGDVATRTTNDIAMQDCVHFSKPVRVDELSEAIRHLLAPVSLKLPAPAMLPASNGNVPNAPVIFVVDDDASVRGAIRAVLEDDGRVVEEFASCEAFLEVLQAGRDGCLLLDAYLPGMTGLSLLRHLHEVGTRMPAIMITGNSDVRMAVDAMKAGALDFIEKPISRTDLLASVDRALELSRDSSRHQAWRDAAAAHVARLTPRQREIMQRVLAGQPSKNIAADLGISQRTVENHRASIMEKMGTKSLPALARLALAATGGGDELPALPA